MKRPYYAPQAEDLINLRLMACLKQENVSEMLHVSLNTVKNWEKGRASIPYSAFKLLKVLSGYELPFDEWEGWSINRGKLFSPSGRSFMSHELLYIGNYFAMARFWIAEREAMHRHQQAIRNTPPLRVIQGGLA